MIYVKIHSIENLVFINSYCLDSYDQNCFLGRFSNFRHTWFLKEPSPFILAFGGCVGYFKVDASKE